MAKVDVYEIITNQIIDQLAKGVIPWQKPWFGSGGAISYASGKPYSFMNQILLGAVGEFITFNQVKKAGGKVNKGAKSKIVIFYKVNPREQKDADGNVKLDADGNPKMSGIPYIQYFRVFNISDCEGIEPKWSTELVQGAVPPIDVADAVFNDYIAKQGIELNTKDGNNASYSPDFDRIKLPPIDRFVSSEEYYSTAFHEAVHSTGHPKRLDRFKTSSLAMFGSESYSAEELVAEIGACASLNRIGIDTEKTFKNSTAYIQSWLQALKNDRKMIIQAASKAEKAVNLMFGDGAEAEVKVPDEAVA